MPIFHVETSLRAPQGAARQLADTLGTLTQSAPGHVWVRIVPCDPSLYAENETDAPPENVWVRVILRALPAESALAALARASSELFARTFGCSIDDVHVYFDPPAAGRIAFGGELVPGRS